MTEESPDSTYLKHDSNRVSLRDFIIVIATLVLGCGLSVGAYFLLDIQEKDRLRFQFERDAGSYAKALQLGIALNIEALQRIQAVFSSGRQLSRAEFSTLVRHDLQRYPGIQGLGWAELVKDGEVETFEQKVREEGLPDFYIGMLTVDGKKVRVPKRSEYVPMVYLEPGPDVGNMRIFGLDLLSEEQRASAIRRARDSGLARAPTPQIASFEANTETDFLVYLPVYQSESLPETLEERRESLLGFAIADFYVTKMIEVALRETTVKSEFGIFIFDTTDASDEMFLHAHSSRQHEEWITLRISELTSGLYWKGDINVAGRTWSIIVRTVAGYIGAKQSWQAILALLSGIIITILIAVSLFISLRRSRERDRFLSDLEQSHLSLGKSEEQFRTLFESSRDALLLVNAEGKAVDCNTTAVEMFGYASADELISEHVSERSPRLQPNGQDSKKLAHKMRNEVLTQGSCFSEWIYRRVDGTEFPVEVQLSRMELKGEPYFQAVIRDITERKQAEETVRRHRDELEERVEERTTELRDSEQRFRSVSQSANDAMISIDSDGRVISWNRAATTMFGQNAKEVTGKSIASLIIPERFRQAHEAGLKRVREGGEKRVIDNITELVGLRAGGSEFPLEISLSSWKAKGETYFNAIIRDITTRKEAEEQLKIAKRVADEANQAKSTFLANMSHELRTPLNAVLGFSELMARDPETSQKQNENLSVINRSGQHLLGLINDVLDMSKIEAGHTELELEPVELHRLLHDISDMFRLRAEAKELAFNLQLQADLPTHILLDVGKLRQVLINLLGNAVKFTEVGDVILRADAEGLPDGNWQLRFEVEDTGAGIPADKVESIFEPFAQTGRSPAKQQGTGLGLAISSQFVQLMGGEITVESTPDEGSVFRFEIPAGQIDDSEIESPYKQTEQRIVGLAADAPEWRILVVEDEADNRLLLRRLLESVGFTVREAVNGEEAIQQFKVWHPQLIWMDMRMPVMDGYEATRRIRKLAGGKEVKILALTASAFKEQEEQCLAAGCDVVLHKPYREQALFAAMSEQLNLHYVYEEDSDVLKQNTLPKLDAKDLLHLPAEWLDEFLTASQLGEIDTLLSLTKTLPASESEIRAKLDHYIHEFQLEYLIEVFEVKRRVTEET
jgi:PAS domain S-box-containing protein